MNKVIENVGLDINKNIKIIAKGTIISLLTTMVLLVIFSAVLTYTSVAESVISPIIIIITAISILLGSQISTRKIKKNGLINGGIIGFSYIILIYLISSIVSGNFALTIYSVIMIIASIVAGLLGGILGVNT